MLFAESSGAGAIIWIIFLSLGVRQWCKWIKGNDVVRGAAKKGLLHVLGRVFKK